MTARDVWHVAGCSVRGAQHVRTALENQDAIDWLPADGISTRVAVSVADGHGSPASFRSATGARLAVQASNSYAAELLSRAESQERARVEDGLDEGVFRRLVQDWKASVDADLSRSPFSAAELALVERYCGKKGRRLAEQDPYLAYGSTLVTAVAAERFAAFWQIGDGDILTVSADGATSRAVRRLESFLGNETNSLCSPNAAQLFQVAVYSNPAPMILLSTDGVPNSFQDDEGFFKLGRDVMQIVASEGLGSVRSQLEGWLSEMTTAGSGDDISLAIACRPVLWA